MTKLAIAKWWIWGELVMIPGFVLTVGSAVALVAHLQAVGPLSWSRLAPDGYSQTMWNLAWLGVAFLVIGMTFQLVAWMGAVIKTRQLENGGWFKALFLSGVAGILTAPAFGVGGLISGSAMIAYLVGGPDVTDGRPAETGQPSLVTKGVIRRWASWAIAAIVAGALFMLLIANLTDPGRLLSGQTWLALTLELLGSSLIGVGVLAMTAAWWGAIFNAHHLADGSWFNVLLWSGVGGAVTSPLFGIGTLIGFGVLIAYVLAGPDGLPGLQPPRSTPAAPRSAVGAS